MEEAKSKLIKLCQNSGDIEQIELELERAGLNAESPLDKFRRTSLFYASFGNKWKLTIYLHVRKGANLNSTTGDSGWTALHWCSAYSRVECAAALKLMGCDVTRRNKEGDDYARMDGGKLEFKQEVEALENTFWKCCEAIQQNEAKHLWRALASSKCLTDLVDKQGNTLLIKAVAQQRFELAEILLKNGADLFFANKNDETALSISMDNLSLESVSFIQNVLRDAKDEEREKILCHSASQSQTKPYLFAMIIQLRLAEDARRENLEVQKTMQQKMNVMQSTYYKKLQDCRNDVMRLNKRVVQLETDQLEMARLVVEEPGERAIQILKASLLNHTINADVSISPSNSREDKEIYEAAKFIRETKQYKAELEELKIARHRNREKLKNQLRSTMSATIIMDDDLIQSIEKSEEKLSEIAPEIQNLKNAISSNNQRILGPIKTEDALCDRHAIVKSFVSKPCAHRVCELCIEEENVCGRCGKQIDSYIKEVERH